MMIKIIRTSRFFLTLFPVLFFLNSACTQEYIPYKDSGLPVEKRVEDLISRMTLEEKVTQLVGNSLQYRQEALRGNDRLDIPNFIIMHGPYGAKFKMTPNMIIGTYFPVSIAILQNHTKSGIN